MKHDRDVLKPGETLIDNRYGLGVPVTYDEGQRKAAGDEVHKYCKKEMREKGVTYEVAFSHFMDDSDQEELRNRYAGI